MHFEHELVFPEYPERRIEEYATDALERYGLKGRCPWRFYGLIALCYVVIAMGIYGIVKYSDSFLEEAGFWLLVLVCIPGAPVVVLKAFPFIEAEYNDDLIQYKEDVEAFRVKTHEAFKAEVKQYKKTVLDELSAFCVKNNYTIKRTRKDDFCEDGKLFKCYKFSGTDARHFKQIRYFTLRVS